MNFIIATSEKGVMSFWKHQISTLGRLVSQFQPIANEWYRSMPRQLKNLHIARHLVLIAPAPQFYGSRGDRWIHRYISGSPLIGRISYPSAFQYDELKVATLTPSSGIRAGAAGRFPIRDKHRIPFDVGLWRGSGPIRMAR